MGNLYVVVMMLCVLGSHGNKEEDCTTNTFNNNDSLMRFTKEANFAEFAVVGRHKALHCCAKGYRTIEWYKDDKPYPWALEVSGLIIFPASANQTIYVPAAQHKDQGNYTCVLRNETVVHSHTIQLKIFDKVPDDSKITYISENQVVAVGDSLRLFCEAFVGHVDLPDAHSEVYWMKAAPNGSYIQLPDHVQQEKTIREEGQTLGTYLIINQTKPEDFSQYICIIAKPGITIERYVYIREKEEEVAYLDPNPIPIAKVLFYLSIFISMFIIAVILYWKFGLKVQVKLKDTLTPVEDHDGKEKDVLIIFAPQDFEIAQGVLIPTLEGKYGYTCGFKELTSTINKWFADLRDEAQKYRRIVAILSPTLLHDNWEASQLMLALQQLKALGPPMTCVSLKELPKNENETKNTQGETLSALIRSIGVILWERKSEEKFWFQLRLKLPPKRKTGQQNNPSLCNNSQECLDVLV